MPDWTFERVDPRELPFDLVSASFRDWFHREPWLEVARCPSCSPQGDFGSAGRFTDFGNGVCPACGSELQEYWTDQRVAQYFLDSMDNEGLGLYVMKEAGDIVAWAWVYSISCVPELADLGPNGTYVDTFGFVVNGQAPFMDLFGWGHLEEQKRGAEYFVYRTHVDAEYIRQVTEGFGYRFLRRSTVEVDREYHIYVPEPL